MKKRITLYADEGMVITDGKNYGTTVFVEVGGDIDKYYEITKEEHDAIMEDMRKAAEEYTETSEV